MVLVVKNPSANAGDISDVGSITGWGRSPGGGHDNPLQCSCLENPMDRGAWWTSWGVSLGSQRHTTETTQHAHTHRHTHTHTHTQNTLLLPSEKEIKNIVFCFF